MSWGSRESLHGRVQEGGETLLPHLMYAIAERAISVLRAEHKCRQRVTNAELCEAANTERGLVDADLRGGVI